jgi:hypothetical protein
MGAYISTMTKQGSDRMALSSEAAWQASAREAKGLVSVELVAAVP